MGRSRSTGWTIRRASSKRPRSSASAAVANRSRYFAARAAGAARCRSSATSGARSTDLRRPARLDVVIGTLGTLGTLRGLARLGPQRTVVDPPLTLPRRRLGRLTWLAQPTGRLDFGRADLCRCPRRHDAPRRNTIAPAGPCGRLRSCRAVPAWALAVVDWRGPRIASRRSTSPPVVAVAAGLVPAGRARSTVGRRDRRLDRPLRAPCGVAGHSPIAGLCVTTRSGGAGSRWTCSTRVGSSTALASVRQHASGIALAGPRRASGTRLGVRRWRMVDGRTA